MDDDGDEYDAYNLSEFSAADFMYIDGTARQHVYDATTQGARTPLVVTSESGGPQIAVALELAADESVVVKAVAGRSGSAEVVDAAQGLGERLRKRAERNDLHRPRHRVDTLSPFEKYRSRGTLSVSDLVGPAWCVLIIRCCRSQMTDHCSAQRCEVQFDYGLRQGRSLAVAKRPESFVSAEGKVIKVEKKVAQSNEKVQRRGRVSVPISSTFMLPHVLLFAALVRSQGIGT
jgi:exonuclease V